MNDEELLNELYYKQHNYDGVEQLYQKAKKINKSIKKTTVSEWLKKQTSNQQTHKKVGKKKFLPIYSETPYSFQIDLTFFPRYKKQNGNYYVLFTAININTRYAYAYYSKDKSMETILGFIEQMEKKTVINSISCDEGKEFNNNEFIKFCDDNKIELYFIKEDSHKLGIINRFHRTIKDKLTKYFIANDTVKWVDIIDKIIHNYNHTVNRGIGIEPYLVNRMIEHELVLKWRQQTEDKDNIEIIFEKGDRVRIKNKRELFQDKMLPQYSSTVFIVVQVRKNTCLVVDGKGNELDVKKSQLLKVNQIDNAFEDRKKPTIERIVKENKSHNKLLREKVDTENILTSTRSRKPDRTYENTYE